MTPESTEGRKKPLKNRSKLYQLEEEMGRLQCKNTFNKIKINRELSETSGSTAARPKHPDPDEAAEITHKNIIMNIIESLKQQMKTSFNEVEEEA